MTNKFIQKLFCCATTPILSVGICLSQAQADETESNNLETVVVSGSKQAYRGDFGILEIPQSELIIDADIMRTSGALDLNDALDLSASVARQNNFGGLWNSFAVRGFVGDENLPSSYLVNGFNAGRGFGGPRDLSGVEAVEILKGPRAALFGRGEPGGTINLVTKRPTFKREGEVKLLVGSFDTYRADLDWTSPLSDSVAVRFVGFFEDADSFRDHVETTKHGMSPSVTWQINSQSQLTYELEYSNQEIPFDRGVVAVNGELGLIPDSRFLGEPRDGPMDAEVLGHQIEFRHDFNENWSALAGFNFRDTSLEGTATEPELSGSRQFLYRDGENLSRRLRYRDYDATYRVFRAELSGLFTTGNIAHRIIFGVDYDKFENDQVFLQARGPSIDSGGTFEQLQVINIFNPVYSQYTAPSPSRITDRMETQKTTGIYFQDQISLTDKLDIRIGTRYDDYSQDLNNRLSNTVSSQNESEFSHQLGVVYKTTDAISFYVVYGENFRPLSGTDANGNGHEPNKSTSIEAGVKFALNDGRLFGNIAVFRVEQDNILAVADPDTFSQAAIGEASSKGFEIDFSGELADGLRLWASYAYVDAQTENEFFDANFGRTIPSGSRLLNIPKQQFNFQLVKQTPVAGKTLEIGAGMLYVDDRNGYFGVDFELPSYATVRTFVSYEATDILKLRLDVDNLFDKEYYTNSFADIWVQPGTPLNATLSAIINF